MEKVGVARPIPAQVDAVAGGWDPEEINLTLAEDLESDPVLAKSRELGAGDFHHGKILPKSSWPCWAAQKRVRAVIFAWADPRRAPLSGRFSPDSEDLPESWYTLELMLSPIFEL